MLTLEPVWLAHTEERRLRVHRKVCQRSQTTGWLSMILRQSKRSRALLVSPSLVYLHLNLITTSSIRLEGELTSVKISQNSQYALINHSPDVRPLRDYSEFVSHYVLRLFAGNPFVGPKHWPTYPQVHRSASRPARYPKLLWRRRWQFRSQR